MKARMLLTVCSIAIALFGAELTMRKLGRYATYTEKFGGEYSSLYNPGEVTWLHVYTPFTVRTDYSHEFSYHFTANNEGLLDYLFDTAKSTNTKRILFLGDSFVQGIGAPYDSSCPKLLEEILSKKFTSNKIEVFNCGVGGSDPVFVEKLLEQQLWKYKPDQVIMAINGTDINDVVIRGGSERFNVDSTVSYTTAPWFEPAYKHSFLFRSILHDVMNYSWMLLSEKQYAAKHKKSVEDIKFSMLRIRNACSHRSVPLLFIWQPLRDEYEKNCYNAISAPDWGDFIYLDILPCVKRTGLGTDDLFWADDKHFNSTGYWCYANCVADAVSF